MYRHTFYLAFKKRRRGWGDLSVRATDRQPNLEAGEVSIQVKAELPVVRSFEIDGR